MRSKPGFTLIELMVVLAIVGMMTAIAYPSFSHQIKQQKFKEQVVEVRDAFLEERGRARAENICILMHIKNVASGIQLHSEDKVGCKPKKLYYKIAEGLRTFGTAESDTLAGVGGALTQKIVAKDLMVSSSIEFLIDSRGGIFSEFPRALTLLARGDGKPVNKLVIIPGTGIVRTVKP